MHQFDEWKAQSIRAVIAHHQSYCEHDFEWIDGSFDHDLGTEVCGHWECVDCGFVDEDKEPPQGDGSDFYPY